MTKEEVILVFSSSTRGVAHFEDGKIQFVCDDDDLLSFYNEIKKIERERISAEIKKLPFGDTAESFAIWVKEMR